VVSNIVFKSLLLQHVLELELHFLFGRGVLGSGWHELVGQFCENGHVSVGVAPEITHHFLFVIFHEELLQVLELYLEVGTLVIGYFLQSDHVLEPAEVLAILVHLGQVEVLEQLYELLALDSLLLVC